MGLLDILIVLIERKIRIVFSSGVSSVASHNIVLKFFGKEKEGREFEEKMSQHPLHSNWF